MQCVLFAIGNYNITEQVHCCRNRRDKNKTIVYYYKVSSIISTEGVVRIIVIIGVTDIADIGLSFDNDVYNYFNKH